MLEDEDDTSSGCPDIVCIYHVQETIKDTTVCSTLWTVISVTQS